MKINYNQLTKDAQFVIREGKSTLYDYLKYSPAHFKLLALPQGALDFVDNPEFLEITNERELDRMVNNGWDIYLVDLTTDIVD